MASISFLAEFDLALVGFLHEEFDVDHRLGRLRSQLILIELLARLLGLRLHLRVLHLVDRDELVLVISSPFTSATTSGMPSRSGF